MDCDLNYKSTRKGLLLTLEGQKIQRVKVTHPDEGIPGTFVLITFSVFNQVVVSCTIHLSHLDARRKIIGKNIQLSLELSVEKVNISIFSITWAYVLAMATPDSLGDHQSDEETF